MVLFPKQYLTKKVIFFFKTSPMVTVDLRYSNNVDCFLVNIQYVINVTIFYILVKKRIMLFIWKLDLYLLRN